MKDGFNRFMFGGFIGLAVITLVVLITRYIVINGFGKPFDTLFYWIGGALVGVITWGLSQIYKKIEGKSDKKDLDNLKEVLMVEIHNEKEVKHEILTTMYSISGNLERMDNKFDSKLTDLNKSLMEHITIDNLKSKK